MISYLKFKELFDNLNAPNEPEIEFSFKNKKNKYMIIKYVSYITFQRCGTLEEQSGEFKFSSLEELLSTKTIDDIVFIDEWDNIEDIIINCTLSVVDDKKDIFDAYGVEL